MAADLLKYRLGARLYAGPASQLVRSEPPAPVQPVKGGPGPLRLMAKKARDATSAETAPPQEPRAPERTKTLPSPPLVRQAGRKADADMDNINVNGKEKRRKKLLGLPLAVMAAVALAAAVSTVPQSALADGHEPWRDEIDFEITEPVEGRRLFIEGLTVSGDRATVTLRAATGVDIRIRAFGGPGGTWLRFWASDRLDEGEPSRYKLPLHGPVPSFTVSWEDGLGQAGALTVEHDRIPHPLPQVEGELCDLRMTSLGWTPGAVSGAVESECVSSIEHPVELQTVAGHENVIQTALMDAGVTAITGDALRSAPEHRPPASPSSLQRRDPFPAFDRAWPGPSRREHRHRHGGEPQHPDARR